MHDPSNITAYNMLPSNPFTSVKYPKSVHHRPHKMYAENEQTLESLLKQINAEKGPNRQDCFMNYEERNIKIVKNPYSPLWYDSKHAVEHRTSEYYTMKDFNSHLGIADDAYNSSFSNTKMNFYPHESNQVQEVSCALIYKQTHAIVSNNTDNSIRLTSDESGPTLQYPAVSFYNSINANSNKDNRCSGQKYWHKTSEVTQYSSPLATRGSRPEWNSGSEEIVENNKSDLNYGDSTNAPKTFVAKYGMPSNATNELNKTPVPLSHALVHDLHKAISSLYSSPPYKVSQLEKVAKLARETYFTKEHKDTEKVQGFIPEQPIPFALLSGSPKNTEEQFRDEQGKKKYNDHSYPVPAAYAMKQVAKDNWNSKSVYGFGYRVENHNYLPEHNSNTKRPNPVPVYFKHKIYGWQNLRISFIRKQRKLSWG